jgi:hypothetical protein
MASCKVCSNCHDEVMSRVDNISRQCSTSTTRAGATRRGYRRSRLLSALATSALSVTALNNVELRPFLCDFPVGGLTGAGVELPENDGKSVDAVRWEGIMIVWAAGIEPSD